MVLALGFISILGGACSVCVCVYYFCVVLFHGVSGQFYWSAVPLRAPTHVLVTLLGSAFHVLALVGFLVFPFLLPLFRGVGASPQ